MISMLKRRPVPTPTVRSSSFLIRGIIYLDLGNNTAAIADL